MAIQSRRVWASRLSRASPSVRAALWAGMTTARLTWLSPDGFGVDRHRLLGDVEAAEQTALHGLQSHAEEAQAARDRPRRQAFADQHAGIGQSPVAQGAPAVPVAEVLQVIF